MKTMLTAFKTFACTSLLVFVSSVANAQTVTPADNSSGATPLSSSTCNTTYTVVGSGYTPASGEPTPCATPGYDVWFSFTAASNNPTITLTISGTNFKNPGIQVWSGSFASMGCSQSSSLTTSSLTIGQTYYIQVFSTSASAPTSKGGFKICIADSPVPPVNDDCSNAGILTPSTTCITNSGTVVNATSAGNSTCSGTVTYDVWYQFVATATSTTLDLSGIGANFVNPGLEILSSCSLSSSMGCATGTTASGVTLNATGLNVGSTYYVRVFSTSGTAPTTSGSFNICVTNPPSNDDAAGAISLPSNTSCSNTGGNLDGATATGSLPAGCESAGTHYDVWYKFTSTSTVETITLSGNAFSSPELQLYSGAPGSLASVSCGTTSIVASGLTENTVYYVRVSNVGTNPTSSGSFNICVVGTAAPANDDCTGAVALTTGTTSGTVWAASQSTGIPSGCSGTADDDVWYKFSSTSDNALISLSAIGSNLSTSGTVIQMFSGSCGSLTSIGCTAGTSLKVAGLTAGTTYYIRVYSSGAGSIGGTSSGSAFSITYLVTPTNDDCSTATSISSSTTCTNTAGTMINATSAGNSSCSGTVGYDVWYTFTAQTANPTITLSSLGTSFTNSGIEILSGCSLSSSLQCTSGTTLTASNLTVGNTYYIRVYSTAASAPTSNGTFNICVKDLPSTSPSGEIFKQTILSGAGAPSGNGALYDPWEVTYGPDKALWVTESKGYKVYRFDPFTGAKTTVLDISNGSSWSGLTTAEHTAYNVKFAPNSSDKVTACNCWPQGGLAGLAISPDFMTATNKYVYISYVYSYDSTSVISNGGVFFTNRLVRFTYNTSTQQLQSPVTICDTIPGSSDHNSQRIIVAPVNGVNYLFYAAGDMGAGQFGNSNRAEYAQDSSRYPGKILRFNTIPDASEGTYDQWIPNDNPYNTALGKQSAVWAIGIRNNQGFAYTSFNGTDILYGGMQGPYSDDEINVLEKGRNFGHPLVEGFAADNNYHNYSAGYSGSTLPIIKVSEQHNADSLGPAYKDPIFSAYAASNAQVGGWWNTTSNGPWATEAWSGLDVYTYTAIPGWKNSLLVASLKKGRVMRLKLDNSTASTIVQTNGLDTVPYFGGQNRFRDLALDSNGRVMYVIMDKSSTTSGPSSYNPSVIACAGCLIRYDFLGFANNASTNQSTIPSYIPITTTSSYNTCISTSIDTITTSKQNNNLWVPFTGPDGNIVAEVNARGNDLGPMQSSFYENSSTMRQDSHGILYGDRSFKITPTNQPTTPVSVRLYITNAEFTALKNAHNSNGIGTGISTISDIRVFKNSDACNSQFTTNGIWITPTVAQAFGTGGYVLQFDISSFSSFYLSGSSMIVLPVKLISFEGVMNNNVAYLNWTTETEKNTSYFSIERSTDGQVFIPVGKVDAHGNTESQNEYAYVDNDACLRRNIAVYYRLRVVDANGSYEYSKVVKLQCNATGIGVDIYPNPISNVLKFKLDLLKADNVNIQVTDMSGHVLYNKSRNIAAGIEQIELNTQAWPAGVYAVKVTGITTNVLVTKNVIKQ